MISILYNAPVRITRFLGLVLYATYLIYAGLFFLISPWSSVWPLLMMRLPIHWATVFDCPAVRGLVSGIGVLHFAMAALELWLSKPTRT